MPTNQFLELIVSQVWQVTVLSVVVGWLTKTALKNQPSWSYQLWLLVMAKAITPPLWASHCGVFSWLFQRMSGVTAWVVQASFGSVVSSEMIAYGLLAIWFVGCAASLGIICTKWLRIQKRITSVSVPTSDAMQETLTRLACELGIPRRVKLVLTSEPVGPAVIGVWKPMIVMPADLVHGKSIEELEPILAHELLHVKRGDTWVAMLETFVRSVWWFHPQVQRAADAMSQAGELCCDQDVLTTLTYSPRRYADSLVQVIEAKCRLQPLIGQPGIRREQVTRKRLERIMTWDQTKPRWSLRMLVLILAMLVVLPGRPL